MACRRCGTWPIAGGLAGPSDRAVSALVRTAAARLAAAGGIDRLSAVGRTRLSRRAGRTGSVSGGRRAADRVYARLGHVARPRFFSRRRGACQSLGRRGILLTRYPEQLPARLPAGVRHFDFVPLGTLLPRAAAIVHHAGIGTLAQGLAAGIPQLSMPMSFDQPDNAPRLSRLGVGLSIRRHQFQTSRVTARTGRIIGSAKTHDRCRDLGSRFDTQPPRRKPAGRSKP